MFLKKLEIIGFKSFAKKTVLDFSQTGVLKGGHNIGITAIVGPNGSGKSNVADALRWAMGEQSMKYLRGKKSHDIIFAGSGKKAKLGSAQVSIYLDNSKKQIPLDFEEVVITRKIYRSGEGEYLVNGAKTRRIDVIDLLAKAGIGQRSYCIVNQGMADQILNATPIERRAIIEEAAGVKEFQIKKERSQRKLKGTKDNLDRVEGLLVEIEPHLKLLKRQSVRAQKGDEYRKQLKEKQQELYGFLWSGIRESMGGAKKRRESAEKEVGEMQQETDKILDLLKRESKDTISLQDKIGKLEEKQRQSNHELNTIERKFVIEEGKLEVEKERARNIKLVEVVPMGAKLVRTGISQIKKQQETLIERLEGIEEMSQLQEVKEYARSISQQMYELYEAVVKGRMEKKKPQEEVQHQKDLNNKKLKVIENVVKSLGEKRKKLQKEIDLLRDEVSKLIQKDRSERRAAIELEGKLRKIRFELDRKKDILNEIRIEIAKDEVKEEDLASRIRSEMRIDPEKIEFKKANVDVAQSDRVINRLKFQLEQIGGIDETVIEEYDETQKRYDFLSNESEDLHEAMKRLKKVVREMDLKIKDRFEEAFEYINKEFEKYFKVIFNGGKARLEKVEIRSGSRKERQDEGDNLSDEQLDLDQEQQEKETEIGIEIFAQPEGKRIASLGMLSGGERTLTSIAVLFAIISHNPPPFAFLDEVEAALDEANSRRFGKIIKELSGKTQFALISHNRQTMKEAALLYGVTMGDDGVSKLLSVKIDEIEVGSGVTE